MACFIDQQSKTSKETTSKNQHTHTQKQHNIHSSVQISYQEMDKRKISIFSAGILHAFFK